MPELPEVEAFRKRALAAVGSTVSAVEAREGWASRHLTPRALDELVERRIQGLDRHGKVLFIRFDRGPCLALHFGESGRLALEREEGEPPEDSLLILHCGDGRRLSYVNRRLGFAALAEDPAGFRLEHGLGPDALEIPETEFVTEIWGRRGPVKAALMDQSLVAGIGNEWSDEILFQARLDPRAECRDLTFETLKGLHQAMRAVLETAVRAGELGPLPPSYLNRPRTAAMTCPRCRHRLHTARIAGRTSRFCVNCLRRIEPQAALAAPAEKRRAEPPAEERRAPSPAGRSRNPELSLIDLVADRIAHEQRLLEGLGAGTLSLGDVKVWLLEHKEAGARFIADCERLVASMERLGFRRQMRRGGRRVTPARAGALRRRARKRGVRT